MRPSTSRLSWYMALSALIHSVCIAWALYTLRVVLDVGDVSIPVRINMAAPELPAAPTTAATAPMLPSTALPTVAFTPEMPPLTASVATPEVVSSPTTLASQPPRIVSQHPLPDVPVVAKLPELAATPAPQATPRPTPPAAEPDTVLTPASAITETPLPAAPLVPVPPAPQPQQNLDQPPVPTRLSPTPPPVAQLVSETRPVTRPPMPQALPTETVPSTPQPPALPGKTPPPETPVSPQAPPPIPVPVVRREPSAVPLVPLAAPSVRELPRTASVPVPRAPTLAEELPAPTVPVPSAPDPVPPALQPPSPPAAVADAVPSLRPPHQTTGPRSQPEMIPAPPLARAAPGPSLSPQPMASSPPSSPPGQPAAEAVPQFAYKPCPQYPYVARRRGLEGVVLLRVQMLANGTVGEVEIVNSSGHSALDSAAIRAVKKWTAIPMRNGTQASHWANVPVNFRLQHAAGADGDGTSATLSHLNCDP